MGVLICGKESDLREDLIKRFLQQGKKLVVTNFGNSDNEGGDNDSCLYFNVKHLSPIAVRSLFLKGINTFGSIDTVLLLHLPQGEDRPIHAVPTAVIQEEIDHSLIGKVFLVREAISYFLKREGGSIYFVLEEGGGLFSPLDSALSGGLKRFVDSLFKVYQNEPIRVNGFTSKEAKSLEYSRFIVKTISSDNGKENSGKWLRFSERGGILGSLKFTRLD